MDYTNPFFIKKATEKDSEALPYDEAFQAHRLDDQTMDKYFKSSNFVCWLHFAIQDAKELGLSLEKYSELLLNNRLKQKQVWANSVDFIGILAWMHKE